MEKIKLNKRMEAIKTFSNNQSVSRRQIWSYPDGSEAAVITFNRLCGPGQWTNFGLGRETNVCTLELINQKEKVLETNERIILQSYKLYYGISTLCFSFVLLAYLFMHHVLKTKHVCTVTKTEI